MKVKNMALMALIVNNYLQQELKGKVHQITHAIHEYVQHYDMVAFSEVTQAHFEKHDVVILSGSKASLTNPRHLSRFEEEIALIRESSTPLLGICFGHQLLGKAFGAEILRLGHYVKGVEEVQVMKPNELLDSWQKGEFVKLPESHEDATTLPDKFTHLARSSSCDVEAMKHTEKPMYGIQAHIERASGEHPDGRQIVKNFFEYVVSRFASDAV